MKGLQLSEPVRLYSRRKFFSFVLFLVTNFSAILAPVKVRRKHAVYTLLDVMRSAFFQKSILCDLILSGKVP